MAIGVNLTRTSPVTNDRNTMFLPGVTKEEVTSFLQDRDSQPLIQDAFPHLDEDQREFILTGMTPKDFKRVVSTLDLSCLVKR